MSGQSPLGLTAVTPSGSVGTGRLDYGNNLGVATQGRSSALNLGAGQHIVKGAAGKMGALIVLVAGTAGTLAVNDAATTGAIAAANLIWTGLDTTAAGTVFPINFPCLNGIAVTVPTGGTVAVSFD
jgi:hypothetical protein